MRSIDKLIDRALSRAFERRYQLGPGVVYMDADGIVTEADIAIMREIARYRVWSHEETDDSQSVGR